MEGVEQGWVRDEKSRVWFWKSRAGLCLEGLDQGWVREEKSRVGLGRRAGLGLEGVGLGLG